MKIISLSSLYSKYLFKYYDVVTFYLFFSLALSYRVFALHSALLIFLKRVDHKLQESLYKNFHRTLEFSFNDLFCIVS